jgi:molecular chaperone GrpE
VALPALKDLALIGMTVAAGKRGQAHFPTERLVDSRDVRISEKSPDPVFQQPFAKLVLVDPNLSEMPPEDQSPAETLEGQLAAVTAERDQLAVDKNDLNDRMLRARAEFENARRRYDRERSEYLQFAAMDMVKDVLPVLDDFERALKVETADSNYAKGVELIYSRLYETLKRLGLEPLDTTGQQFDPNIHQAVERVPTEEAEDQSVVGEFQRGYNFKGKLLRPAMVRVAVKP